MSEKQVLLQSIRQLKQIISEKIASGEDAVLFFQSSAVFSAASVPLKKQAEKAEKTPTHPLGALAETMKTCQQCALAQTRHQVVFGEGDAAAKLVFIGEAPGAEEDLTGRPFVGASGQLLEKIIASLGLGRADVYLCNLLKCRLPGNRNPLPAEIAACKVFLEKQLSELKPDLICTLGAFASQALLNTHEPLNRLRGQKFYYHQIPVIPTLHPESLLYYPENKRLVWEDMKQITAILAAKHIMPEKGM